MAQKIIIDTDPGIDDAMAIFFALQSPELEVLGLTAVFGNGGVENTASNAVRILETAGRGDIPVAKGADSPLVIPKRFDGGASVHGHDGLGNAGQQLPQPQGQPIAQSAAAFIVKTVMANPGEVMLVPIGPLTNIALALRLEPALVDAVKGISLMGGSAFAGGNVTAAAEANLYNDPHAAAIVFAAGWPIVMAGWDVNNRFHMNQAYLDKLCALDNPATAFIEAIYPCLQAFVQLPEQAIDVPDLLAMAYLVDPTLFTAKRYPVYVETEGRTAGMTVVDQRPFSQDEQADPEIDILLDVDADRLRALFLERLRQYG
ncbi:MAG: nucleoside hydrolase [Chloroflexota bacterium]